MQTSILASGSRLFKGDVDRFSLFALIARAALAQHDRGGGISAHSMALSLGRPFETVRRHVNALIDDDYCIRTARGVTVAPEAWGRPGVVQQQRLSHDCFVRFVADGGFTAPIGAGVPYRATVGIQAAVDIMLAALDSNRGVHGDALDLVLFSTILQGNIQRFLADPFAIEGGAAGFLARHAVRTSALARTLAIPETTVRRRLAASAGPGRPIERIDGAYVASAAWLRSPGAQAVTERTASSLRRIVGRVAALGFPIDDPARAYLDGRPPEVLVL